MTWSLGGADAALFTINAATGAIAFKAAPNFEAPADTGGDNVYDIIVTASDGTLTASKAVAITVTNVNEAPSVTSGATANFAENGAGVAYQATGTDPDAGTTLAYGLSGTDAALFDINAGTGAVTFKMAPNFEAPADTGGDNVYDIIVTASDGTLTASKAVAIAVTNINEAPSVTSGATANFAENDAGVAYQVTATDPDAGTTLVYGLSGTDAALFDINASTGAVTFKTPPDFEAPADNGANNVYDFIVTASDGTLTANKAVAITATNVDDAPVITSGATGSFAENGRGTAYQVTVANRDAGPALTYSLSGTDAALFDIIAGTGAVIFRTPPDFEAPGDVGANNVYDIIVTASDGTLTANKVVAITVTNVNEVPTVTSAPAVSFAENDTRVAYVAAATDPDAGTSLTWSLGGADAALFALNAATGEIAFKASPNFEAPADNGANNVYDLTVTASDGSLTASKAVAITVTDMNETPEFVETVAFSEGAVGPVYRADLSGAFATLKLTYSLGGVDAALFSIVARTGAITFKVPPELEAPGDVGANNVYDLTVAATDGLTASSSLLSVIVVDAVDILPDASGAITANGTARADRIVGKSGDDLLDGAGGADTLLGGVGNDTLIGGMGQDSMLGQGGADVFRYGLAAEGGDLISQFRAVDRVEVSAAGFGGGLAPGMNLVATGQYVENTTGLSTGAAGTGQFVFNTAAQTLAWDADGSGGSDATILFTLSGALGWSGASIVVIA